MEKIFTLLSQTEMTTEAAVFRLVLSLILGGLIGIDRERSRQAAGLRTHILISTASTLLMIISAYVPQKFEFEMGDPGRIAAQVVSGIGFLGAGAILRLGVSVRGLTTAASIWAVAAIGIAVGTGFYQAAVFATLLLLFVLMVLNKLEKVLFPFQIFKILKINFQTLNHDSEEIEKIFIKNNVKTGNRNVSQDYMENTTTYTYYIYLSEKTNTDNLVNDISTLPNIKRVNIENREI